MVDERNRQTVSDLEYVLVLVEEGTRSRKTHGYFRRNINCTQEQPNVTGVKKFSIISTFWQRMSVKLSGLIHAELGCLKRKSPFYLAWCVEDNQNV